MFTLEKKPEIFDIQFDLQKIKRIKFNQNFLILLNQIPNESEKFVPKKLFYSNDI